MSEYSRDYSAVQLVPAAFPIRAQVPFDASSVWIVNNTAARMFVSRRSGSPTQNDKDASIPAYNAQPIYGWDLDLINVGYDGAAIQTTDSLSVYATSDPNRSWPAAPIQPPFVLPAGAATEATLAAFKAANHTDLGAVNTTLAAFEAANHADLGAVNTTLAAFEAANHADLGAVNTTIGTRLPYYGTFWSAVHAPAINTRATVTKAAPGAGKQLIVTGITATFINDSGSSGGDEVVNLVDGSGATLWTARLAHPASPAQLASSLVVCPVTGFIAADNQSVTLAFPDNGPAGGGFQTVAMNGYVVG